MAEDKKALKGSEVVSIGWVPIMCKQPPLARDLTFHFLVGVGGKPGQLTTSRKEFDHAKAGIGAGELVKDGELGDEKVGRALAAWAAGEKHEGSK
jgi:hypothetical protein